MATQLVQANVNITEKAGLCLQYARRVFGLPAVEPTAHAAIANLKYLHKDKDFPKGVSFPVWFEWWGDLHDGNGRQQYDHAAVMYQDGKVYSSPLSGTGHAWFNSVDDLVRAFGGGMKYIGWSEDISGTRVIEGDDMSTVDLDTAKRLLLAFFTKEQVAAAGGDKYVEGWVGTETNSMVQALANSPQFKEKRLHYEGLDSGVKPDSSALDKLEKIKAILG